MTNLVIEAQRIEALTVDCDYCSQTIGKPCIDRAGDPVVKQAAHWVRIKKAGERHA